MLYVGPITAGIPGGMAVSEGDVLAALHGEGARQQYGARLSTHLRGSLGETLTDHAELRALSDFRVPGRVPRASSHSRRTRC